MRDKDIEGNAGREAGSPHYRTPPEKGTNSFKERQKELVQVKDISAGSAQAGRAFPAGAAAPTQAGREGVGGIF